MSFLLAILWVIFAALICWQLLRWLPAGADKYNPLPYIIALLPLATYVAEALFFVSLGASLWNYFYAPNLAQSYNFAKSYAYLCIAYAVLFLISLKSYSPYWFGRFRSARKQTPENLPANVPQQRKSSDKRQKIYRQMFHNNANPATNARKFTGKCSTTTPIQRQTPENLPANVPQQRQSSDKRQRTYRQMFQNNANPATKAGKNSGKCSTKQPKQRQTPENLPANVPNTSQSSYIFRKNQPLEIRVMTLNCRYGKASATQIIETAKKYSVNTLLLQELSESLVKNLEKLGIYEIFPTSCVGARSEHNNGGFNAIFTQYSAISTCNNSVKIEAASVPSVTARLDFDASANVFVKFASAHPKSPMRGCKAWSEGIRALANLIDSAETYETDETTETAENPKSSESATLTILTGDLNSAIDHPSFRTLIKAGFTDSAITLGRRLRTWPTWLKWPNLTLDYVLFCAKNCRAQAEWQQNVEIAGTDHLAYIAAIALYPLHSPTYSPLHSPTYSID